MISTCCLKRGDYGLLCSPNAFHSDLDNSTRWKKVLSWNSQTFPRAKWSFEAEIVPLIVVLRWNENGNPPFFKLCFSLVMTTRKIYIKEGKLWIVEVEFFFSYIWMTRISVFRATVRDNVKTINFSTFFQDRVIWGYLKIKPRSGLKVLFSEMQCFFAIK